MQELRTCMVVYSFFETINLAKTFITFRVAMGGIQKTNININIDCYKKNYNSIHFVKATQSNKNPKTFA
jgi:hypothetical protein